MITRDDLLKPSKRRFKEVQVDGVGDGRIRSLTTSEMRGIRQSLVDKKGDIIQSRAAKLQELLVGNCLVDGESNRLLSDNDVFSGALDNLDAGALTALFNICKEFTGFAADEDWKAIEDASKNSAPTTASSCSTGSPSGSGIET